MRFAPCLFWFLTTTTAWAGSEERCKSWTDFLSEAKEKQAPMEDVLPSVLHEIRYSQVVILGEHHTGEVHPDQETYKSYLSILPLIEREIPEMDCLFTEDPVGSQPAVDQYLSGQVGFSAIYNSVMAIIQAPPFEVSWADKSYFRFPYDASIQNSWKVFSVDLDIPPGVVSDELLYRRNHAIAGNISSLFQSSQCKRGVLIVGAGHLLPGVNDPHQGMKAQLEEVGISSRSVELFPMPLAFSEASLMSCPNSVPHDFAETFFPTETTNISAIRTTDLSSAVQELTLSYLRLYDRLPSESELSMISVKDRSAWIFYRELKEEEP